MKLTDIDTELTDTQLKDTQDMPQPTTNVVVIASAAAAIALASGILCTVFAMKILRRSPNDGNSSVAEAPSGRARFVKNIHGVFVSKFEMSQYANRVVEVHVLKPFMLLYLCRLRVDDNKDRVRHT